MKVKKAIIVVGSTASGKNHLVKSLGEDNKEVISVTDRLIRDGEVDGVTYIYLNSKNESIGNRDEFIERIDFGGFSYGIRIKEFNLVVSLGKIPVFIVEQNGVLQVSEYLKKNHPECVVDIIHLDLSRFARYQNLLMEYAKKYNSKLYDKRCQTYALDRLVRNGDNISEKFKMVWPDIKNCCYEKSITDYTNIDNTIQYENLLGYNLFTIKSREELTEFISIYNGRNKDKETFHKYLTESNIYIL